MKLHASPTWYKNTATLDIDFLVPPLTLISMYENNGVIALESWSTFIALLFHFTVKRCPLQARSSLSVSKKTIHFQHLLLTFRMEHDHLLLISAHVTAATAEVEHQTSEQKKRPGFICAGALYAYIVCHCLEGRQDILFGDLAYSTTGLDNHHIIMFRKTSITPPLEKNLIVKICFHLPPRNLGIKKWSPSPPRL